MAKAVDEVLNELLAATVSLLGYEYWGHELFRQGKYSLLRVYIDAEKGVTLEDCERASRQISSVLDVEDPIQGSYSLEVSSPGVDRQLFNATQYQKYIGQTVKVRVSTPQNGRRNFAGKLTAVDDAAITVMGDGETWVLSLAEIEKANLVPEFGNSRSK